MGKRLRKRKYDEDEIPRTRRRPKDDRPKADKVKTDKQFDAFLDQNGAVADAIQEEGISYKDQIVKYKADGVRTVDRENVKKAVVSLRDEITSTRFTPKEEVEKIARQTIVRDDKGRELTTREKNAEIAYDYQVRAVALLTAARVGDVKLSTYDRGVLNRLAEGQYTDVVYGKVQSDGKRQYERGTFKSKLGFGRGSVRSSTPEGRARANELRERLREANRVA